MSARAPERSAGGARAPWQEPEPTPWATIVELVGEEPAARLSRSFGGCRVYIPQRPGPHHPLSVCIGDALAGRIAEAFAGHRLDIPLRKGRRALIVELRGQGHSVARIAREVGCTERHVYQVLAEVRPDGRQPGLFDAS